MAKTIETSVERLQNAVRLEELAAEALERASDTGSGAYNRLFRAWQDAQIARQMASLQLGLAHKARPRVL